jgi:hypothetical protein
MKKNDKSSELVEIPAEQLATVSGGGPRPRKSHSTTAR